MVHSRRVTVAWARPLACSSRAKDSMSARRMANKFREWTEHQVVNWRRSSVYASRVSPRYPARNPARASRSGSVKTGWIVASAVDGAVVVIGVAPGNARAARVADRTHVLRYHGEMVLAMMAESGRVVRRPRPLALAYRLRVTGRWHVLF